MRPNELSQPVQATHGATPATPATFDARVTVAPAKPGKMLRLPAVELRTGLRKSTIYALVAAKSMPAPVRLSARCVAWQEDELDRWVLDRMATRGR